MPEEKNIEITVLINDEKYVLNTYTREYRNLMVLIRDNIYLDDFGECGGMGRCCTCLVEVINKDVELPIPDGNEAANLAKHQVTASHIRLSCQLMLEEKLNNLIVRI